MISLTMCSRGALMSRSSEIVSVNVIGANSTTYNVLTPVTIPPALGTATGLSLNSFQFNIGNATLGNVSQGNSSIGSRGSVAEADSKTRARLPATTHSQDNVRGSSLFLSAVLERHAVRLRRGRLFQSRTISSNGFQPKKKCTTSRSTEKYREH